MVEQRAQSKTEAEAVKDPTAATRWSERLYTARLEVRTLSAAPIFLMTRDANRIPHGSLTENHFNPSLGKSGYEEVMSKRKIPQTWRLRYLYVGTSNIQKDVDHYTKVLGANKVWDISSFGTRVAALQLGEGPLLLLADHRPAPSCIMIFQVGDLQTVSKELRQKGWKP